MPGTPIFPISMRRRASPFSIAWKHRPSAATRFGPTSIRSEGAAREAELRQCLALRSFLSRCAAELHHSLLPGSTARRRRHGLGQPVSDRREPHEKLNFANAWHSDLSYLDAPPSFTILYCLEAPPVGGDTVWANQYQIGGSRTRS